MKKGFLLLLTVVAVGLVFFVYKHKNTNSVNLSKNINGQTNMRDLDIKISNLITDEKINAWFVPCNEVPVITIGVMFLNAGDKAVAQDKIGLTTLLAEMLNEGTNDLDSRAFKEFLLEKNIHLSVNADSDNFRIVIQTIKENTSDAILLLNKIILTPRFEEKDMVKVKEQLINDLKQSLYNEKSVAKEQTFKFLLGEHPYARSVEQVIDNLPKIDASDLRKFMKGAFLKGNLVIAVSGNIDEKELIKLLDKNLGDLPDDTFDPKTPNVSQKVDGKTHHHQMPIPQSIIYFAQPAIDRHHKDFYAAFLLNSILGGLAFESVLWDEIREKNGLAYYINVGLLTKPQWNTFLGVTATENKNVTEVIKKIKENWRKIKENGVTQAQLEFHKKNITGEYPLRISSTLDIVHTMLSYQSMSLPVDYINKRNTILSSVTLEDVNRVAKELLDDAKLNFVVVGK